MGTVMAVAAGGAGHSAGGAGSSGGVAGSATADAAAAIAGTTAAAGATSVMGGAGAAGSDVGTTAGAGAGAGAPAPAVTRDNVGGAGGDANMESGESSASSCTGAPLTSGDHAYTISSANGITYDYILSVPSSVDPTRRAPLFVHWHALSSSPEEARELTTVDAKAEAAQMLVVYPRSPDESWDVGSCCTNIKGGTSRDEIVFARELIADVTSKACVDEKRIYTNGFSNGGMISQALACEMSEVFAAAAPMGSTLTIDASMCKPSRPMPMLLINGTEDPLVGYNAPSSAGGISVVDDVTLWADKNHCTGTPELVFERGKASCSRFTQCENDAEVMFCSVEGMGHCVPGMIKESETNCLTKTAFGIPLPLGAPNDDIDAIQMSFDFVMRFSLL